MKEETTTFTATGFNPSSIETPPKKKTWKDYGKDLLGMYLCLAIGVGTGQILAWIVLAIIWLVKHF